MKAMNIQLAGDFMVMAATLMRIKAQMLLPLPEIDDFDIEDPRRELVEMLIEYKRFKEVAGELEQLELENVKSFPRRLSMEAEYGGPTVDDSLIDVTLFDLMSIIKQVVEDMPEEIIHQVELFQVTIEEQMGVVLSFFGDEKEYSFYDLIKSLKNKVIVVVTFLAILELMKNQRVKVYQEKYFGEIRIRKS